VSDRGYCGEGGVGSLTPRMIDVLRAAARGRTAEQTGDELYISVHTVKTIRASACARLGVTNVTAAVALTIRAGRL
jgi:DNA-binding CsgD family transcriptional regulator